MNDVSELAHNYLQKIETYGKNHDEAMLSVCCREAYQKYSIGLLSEEEYEKIYVLCMTYADPR